MYDNFVSVDPMEQTLLESAEERFLCRCCFKMFEFMEVQHLVDDNMTRMFQEVTDLVLIPCTRAPTVCGSCYGQMQRLVKFKELLILKQDQFELIMSCGGDLSELSGAKWKSENLNEDFLFEEETSEQDVQEVTLNQSVDGEDEEVDSFQQEISIDGDSDEGGDTSFVSNTSLASKNRTKGLSKIFVCDVCGEKPSTKRSLRYPNVTFSKSNHLKNFFHFQAIPSKALQGIQYDGYKSVYVWSEEIFMRDLRQILPRCTEAERSFVNSSRRSIPLLRSRLHSNKGLQNEYEEAHENPRSH